LDFRETVMDFVRQAGAHQSRRTFIRTVGFSLTSLALLPGCAAERSPTPKPRTIPRIGLLSLRSRDETSAVLEALEQGLHEHNWVVGQDVAVEERFADGVEDQLPVLATELAHENPTLIVTDPSPRVAQAAKLAAPSLPIVMAGSITDPIADGLVADLARTDSTTTGVANSTWLQGGERLALLKRVVPQIVRVAYLGEARRARSRTDLLANTARSLGIQFQVVEVGDSAALDGAFQTMREGFARALIVEPTSPLLWTERSRIANLAVSNRLPSMFAHRECVEDGGLAAYAPRVRELIQRAVPYVDKILRGAEPAELPVALPLTFDFVLNLRTAQALGLTISPTMLSRATEVIQ
jgi:putative ABC transport system substrate-binding protein